MKAIIYARVATDENNGLKKQMEILQKYCSLNQIKVVKHFEEMGSGLNFNRPEWEKLIEFTNKNKIDKILITSWDRVGRNFDKVYTIIKHLAEKNIEVITIDNSDFNIITFQNIKL